MPATKSSESPGKNGQAAEDLPYFGREEIVAPSDGGAERLQALRLVAGAAAEKVQAVIEPRLEGARRQDFAPRGGQLDGQRQAVQPAADGDDGGRILRLERKARADGPGAFDEEADGWIRL